MNDNHDQHGQQPGRLLERDEELDAMLAPLRRAMPKGAREMRWQAAIDEVVRGQQAHGPGRVGRRLPRYLEWAVAAAIGFACATLLSQSKSTPTLSGEGNAESIVNADVPDANYYDVDATAIQLAANSE